MSTFTENYSLIKPDTADYYDVADFNDNMDIIDTLMAESDAMMEEINEKIGAPDDTSNNTLFGRLNSGTSPVKSIQKFKITIASKSGNITQAITPVDANRCLVFLNRLNDPTTWECVLNYTLNSESIVLTSSSAYTNNVNILIDLQIIEFY